MKKNDLLFSVVMPVYNVEDYIKESIESLIKQTIDFEKNVQLILVNDGSPDNSEKVCLEYAKKYPENVLYIKQKNQGVSVARNTGIEAATGKYINFLDSDDILDSDVLEKVLEFFKENEAEVDLVAIPLIYFEGRQGNHMLHYKFSSTRVIDTNEEPESVQMQCGSTFIKRLDGLGELRFKVGQKFGEDASLLTDVIMKKKKFGVIHDSGYNYRVRIAGTSALQSSSESKDNYFPILEDYFLPKLKKYNYEYGHVPKYVQFVIMYDLQWRLRLKETPEVIVDEIDRYYDNVLEILQYIDKDIIMKQNYLNWYQKHALCCMKNTNKRFHPGEQFYNTVKKKTKKGKKKIDDIVVIDNDGSVKDRLANRSLDVDICEIDNGRLKIMGRLGSLFPSETMKVYIKDSENKTYESKEIKYPNENRYLTGTVIFEFFGFEFDLKIEEISNTRTLRAFLEVEGIAHQVPLKFSPAARLSNKITNSYLVYNDNLMIGYNHKKNRFDFNKYSFKEMLKKEKMIRAEMKRKKVKNHIKISFTRILVRLLKKYKKNQINLFMDRIDKADDSAEVLINYFEDNKNGKKQKNYFVLKKSSSDYKRLKSKLKMIGYKNYRHKLLFLISDNLISTHCDRFIYQPYTGTDNYFRDLKEYKFTFLQHGITKDDMSSWLKKYDKNFKLFITSSKLEQDSIINGNYVYTDNEIKLTGLPRFDKLVDYSDDKNKTVLVMPTWRKEIVEEFSHEINDRPYSEKFKHSEYFIKWNEFLNDKALLNYLNKKNYNLIFVPHPSIRQQLSDFNLENISIAPYEESYASLMQKASILITDYSSVYFDFAYMNKPMFYYHFDNGNWDNDKGYFSYEDMGFGEITMNHDELINKVINNLENGAKMQKKYKSRVNSFYQYTDQNNSKRVYEEIMKLNHHS